MTKSSSLKLLIDLKEDETNKVVKQLQEFQAERRHADEQLNTLLTYRQDYAVRLEEATKKGVAAANYHNFRQFISTLDEAILQQNRVVDQIDTKIQASQQHWLEQKRRLKSFQTLQTRHAQQHVKQENRAEQLDTDEASAALYRRARHLY